MVDPLLFDRKLLGFIAKLDKTMTNRMAWSLYPSFFNDGLQHACREWTNDIGRDWKRQEFAVATGRWLASPHWEPKKTKI